MPDDTRWQAMAKEIDLEGTLIDPQDGPSTAMLTNPQVKQKVYFGRPHGEKTLGEIAKDAKPLPPKKKKHP